MSDSFKQRAPTVSDVDLGSSRRAFADETTHRLREAEDWAGLAKYLGERMGEGTEDARDIAALLAQVLEENLSLLGEAAEIHEWVLEQVPGDTCALNGLVRLYTEQERWEALVDTYDRHQKETTDVFEKTNLLEKIAILQADILGDVASHRETCLEAMKCHPGCVWAWEALQKSHGQDDSWWTLVENLTQVAMTGETHPEAGMVTLRLAMIMDEHLDLPDKAIALYEAAIETSGDPRSALLGLEGLYAETDNWSSLSHTYERLGPLAVDTEEAAKFTRRWAMVLADGLGNVPRAITMYDKLLEVNPDDKESFQAVVALQKRLG